MCTAGIKHRGQWMALSNWPISVGSKSNGTWSVAVLSNIKSVQWVGLSNRTTWSVVALSNIKCSVISIK